MSKGGSGSFSGTKGARTLYTGKTKSNALSSVGKIEYHSFSPNYTLFFIFFALLIPLTHSSKLSLIIARQR